MDFREAYKGKKVLITGHTGFKGGWLSIWLKMLGADVYGYSLDPIQKDGIFLTSGIGEMIHDIRGDIRDLITLSDIFQKIQPDIIFHLAAQSIVIESYYNPVETFEVNILGTVNVLEAIRQTPSIKAAIMVTSDKCYENKERLRGYREYEPMGGHDPYSASKGSAELVINAYRRSFFHKKGIPAIASVRAGNVIGGGDWTKYRLLPDIFRAIEKDEIIEIRNPLTIRPWQHVLEALGAYLLLGQKLMIDPVKFAEAWNFGPLTKKVYTVKEMVNHILKSVGKGSWIDISNSDEPYETKTLVLDISKAIQRLQWQPVFDISDTVRLTTQWYMNYKDNDVLKLSQGQIAEYEQKWRSKNVN
jgi:CDP-glucose 4,6-dehydratase